VTLVLGNGIVAVRPEGGLLPGESAVVMEARPLLSRKRAPEWANAIERKFSRLSRRTADVGRLYAEIQKSPSSKKTGAILLEHVDEYDDDFFEALAGAIARDLAHLRLGRARNLEALRDYLHVVRRRAGDGETAAMWGELARGAAAAAGTRK
jgi:hypothetical protein